MLKGPWDIPKTTPRPASHHLQLVPSTKNGLVGMGLFPFISTFAIKHLSFDQEPWLSSIISLDRLVLFQLQSAYQVYPFLVSCRLEIRKLDLAPFFSRPPSSLSFSSSLPPRCTPFLVSYRLAPNICECCQVGKSFTCHSSLWIHKRTHTREKPCQYNQCGKAFACPNHI